MKMFFGALALAIAIPATAQTAPAADPHAGHAKHGQQKGAAQHGGMAHHDHAKMMDECKKAMAEGKCAEHCKAMMEKHGASAKAPSAPGAESHEGHAH